jgi:Holliday junction resolvase-like predicted endonuclease
MISPDFLVPPPIKVRRKVSEKQVEAYLRAAVKKLGGECYKWSSRNVRGVPDRVCVFPGGHVYFVEVKTKTGKLSTLQQKFINKMDQLGMNRTWVVYGKEQIDNFIDEVKRVHSF